MKINPTSAVSAKRVLRPSLLNWPWTAAPALLALGCSQAPPPDDTAPSDTTTDTTADTSDETPVSPTDTTTDTTDPGVEPDTSDVEPDTSDVEPDTSDVEPDTSDVEPDTSDVEPDTSDVAPIPTGVDPPVDDPLEYFPLGDGYKWTYDHLDGETVQWVEEVTMTATTWNGQAAWKVQDSPDSSGVFDVQTWVVTNERVERVHRDEFQGNTLAVSVDYTPGFTRFAAAWTTPGYTETIQYTRDERDASGAIDSKVRYQKYEVESVGESVEVGGTTYDDCVVITRVRLDEQGNVQVDSANNPDSNARYWYCRGVGKVQEENLVSGSREELTSHTF